MALNLDQMRHFVWRKLQNIAQAHPQPTNPGQPPPTFLLTDLERAIIAMAGRDGLLVERNGDYLGQNDDHLCRIVVSELVTSGIIVLGNGWNTPNLPWMQITEFGVKCIQTGVIQPYDSDGYLSRMNRDIPNIDDTALRYLQESLDCLRRECLMASMVMLGGASEKIFILLTESLHGSIQDPIRKKRFEKNAINDWRLKRKFDAFRKEMDIVSALPIFPNDLREDLDVKLLGIFSLIRQSRNDVGHPSGKSVTKEDVNGNLLLFMSYCKTAYALMHFFNNNAV
jgi:hypothetical protein